MNNKLRLHELWRGLSNCKYKKNHGFTKKTFIHNCTTEYNKSTYLVKTRFPISKYVKKTRICYISEFLSPMEFEDYLLSQNNLFAVVMPVGIFAELYKRSLRGYKNLRGVGPTAFAGAANVGIPVRLQSENVSG